MIYRQLGETSLRFFVLSVWIQMQCAMVISYECLLTNFMEIYTHINTQSQHWQVRFCRQAWRVVKTSLCFPSEQKIFYRLHYCLFIILKSKMTKWLKELILHCNRSKTLIGLCEKERFLSEPALGRYPCKTVKYLNHVVSFWFSPTGIY